MRDTLRLSKIDLGGTKILCNSVYVRLDAENIGAEYRWSTGDSSRRIVATDSGTYWVMATYGCGTERDTTHLKLMRSPTHVLPNDTTYCIAVYDTLDAINDTIPEVRYKWSTGDTVQRIVIVDTGMYTVRISTPNCGVINDNIYISLKELPEVTLPKDSLFCSSISLDLKADFTDDDVKYKWSTGDTTQDITAMDTGLYQVITSNFCGKDTAQVYLTMDTIPSFKLPEDSLFCDTVNLLLTPGAYSSYTNLTYSNNFYDSRSQNDLDYFEIRDIGNYWIELKNGCGTARDSIVITKLYTPQLEISSYDTLCNNEKLRLIIGVNDNEETYLWLPDNTNSNTFNIIKPGKYIAQVNNKCGTLKDSIEVEYFTSPTASLGIDSVFCETINETLTVGLAGNNEKYLWSTSETTSSINVSKEGEYSIIVTNYCGNVKDTVSYSLLLKPEVSLGEDKIFCGDALMPLDLDAGNNNREEQYLWSTKEITQILNVIKPGLYEVTLSNKCGSVTDDIELILTPYPEVNLGLDTNFCGLFEYELNAGNPGASFSWYPSGNTGQNVTLSNYGTHTVTVRDAYGCESKDEISIEQKCSTLFYIPNAFTPNGNGKNEVFKPVMNDIFEFQFNIYNRWGELIFATSNLEEGWDGTFNGSPCMQGMYLWTVDRLGVDKREHSDGSVFLKR